MKLTYLWVLMLLCLNAFSQQDYYVLIQQPTGKPFYVRMGEESYSSSATGHLILSSMKDTLYDMYIGFPQGQIPEQLFRMKVEKKDRGFELKQFDGSWQLMDIQNKQLIRSVGRVVQVAQGVKRTDTYSQLMAGVVDDTTVLYIDSMAYADTSAAAVKARESQKVQVVSDSLVVAVDTSSSTVDVPVAQERLDAAPTRKKRKEKAVQTTKDSAASNNTVATNQPASSADTTITHRALPANGRDPRDIIRFRTENVVEGRLMIFVDRTGPVADTIRIIVPR